MSLRDEFPSHDQSVVFSRIRYSDHEDIDQQISEFIACGGAITQIPSGATSDPLCLRSIKNEFTGLSDYDQRLNKRQRANMAARETPRPDKRSRFGQNIQQRSGDGNPYYIVYLSGKVYGTGLNWPVEQARLERDRLCRDAGMPAAEY